MSLLLSHRTSHFKKILKSGKNKKISWTPEFHTSSRVSRTLPSGFGKLFHKAEQYNDCIGEFGRWGGEIQISKEYQNTVE
jgi:hypothetical protein